MSVTTDLQKLQQSSVYKDAMAASGVMSLITQATDILKAIWPSFSLKSNGFSDGEEVLGEKYMYHILGENITNRNLVPVDQITTAKAVMPVLFGVPIYDAYDMNALEKSVAEYKKSPRAQGVPDAAIERAVFLKQNYFPYAKRYWVVKDAEKIPPVNYTPPGPVGQLPGQGSGLPIPPADDKNKNWIWVGIGIAVAGLIAVFAFMKPGKRGRSNY